MTGRLRSSILLAMLRTSHRGGALMVRGIKFAGIPVRNQDVSLKFYTEALGLKVVTDQPFTDKQRWIELLIPGAETGVALYTPEGHEKRIGEFQSIAFWCDDVFATAKVLKSKGVTFDLRDRKSTRLNSSHLVISYAVFCLKKKTCLPI